MTTTVLIVTSDFYAGESLSQAVKTAFGNIVSVETMYRTYSTPVLHVGDIVLSDGTCKDRDDDGCSYPVRFNASQVAQKSGAAFVSFGRKPAQNPFTRLLQRLGAPRRAIGTDAVINEVRMHLK